MAEPAPDWRAAMTREDRIQICLHSVNRLLSCRVHSSADQLRARMGSFEVSAFEQATSREDYLQRIAVGFICFQISNDAIAAAAGGSNWRKEIKREDRIKIWQHIVDKVLICRPNSSQGLARVCAACIEVAEYELATSLQNYLQRIAARLSQFENGNSCLEWLATMNREDNVKVSKHISKIFQRLLATSVSMLEQERRIEALREGTAYFAGTFYQRYGFKRQAYLQRIAAGFCYVLLSHPDAPGFVCIHSNFTRPMIERKDRIRISTELMTWLLSSEYDSTHEEIRAKAESIEGSAYEQAQSFSQSLFEYEIRIAISRLNLRCRNRSV